MLYLAEHPLISDELPFEFNLAAEGIRIVGLTEKIQNFVFRYERPCIAESKWFGIGDRFYGRICVNADNLQSAVAGDQRSHFSGSGLNANTVPYVLQDSGRFAVVSQNILNSGTGHSVGMHAGGIVIHPSTRKSAVDGLVFDNDVKMRALRIDDSLRVGVSRFGCIFRSLGSFFGGSQASANEV